MKKLLFFTIVTIMTMVACEKEDQYNDTGETYYKFGNLDKLEYISAVYYGEYEINAFLNRLNSLTQEYDGTQFSAEEIISEIQEVVEFYDNNVINGSFNLMSSNNGENGKYQVVKTFNLNYGDSYDYLFKYDIANVYGSWFENSCIFYDSSGNVTDEFYYSMTEDYIYGVLTLKSDAVYEDFLGRRYVYNLMYIDKVYSEGNKPTESEKDRWYFSSEGINMGGWAGEYYYGTRGEIVYLDRKTMKVKNRDGSGDYSISTFTKVDEPKHNF